MCGFVACCNVTEHNDVAMQGEMRKAHKIVFVKPEWISLGSEEVDMRIILK
jgi:hypothetical protein